MESIRLKTRVDYDGVLRLEVPLPFGDRELEVLLVYESPIPDQERGVSSPAADTEWPAGFFTEVAGGWQGEPLTRQPQGAFESRPPLK